MVKRLGIIVQAHMGSTRLPNKMLHIIKDKTVLGHVICRLKNVSNADDLIIATSDLYADDAIIAECEKYYVNFYRGDDKDVLSRFFNAAIKYELSDIARVCADNTLLDFEVIENEIDAYRTGKYALVCPSDNLPLGLGCEIFSFSMLKDAYNNGKQSYHREHVTPYIYENYDKPYRPKYSTDLRKYRFTLDTYEDLQLIEQIYEKVYRGEDNFLLKDVIGEMERHPEWIKINENIRQKSVYA